MQVIPQLAEELATSGEGGGCGTGGAGETTVGAGRHLCKTESSSQFLGPTNICISSDTLETPRKMSVLARRTERDEMQARNVHDLHEERRALVGTDIALSRTWKNWIHRLYQEAKSVTNS